MKTEMGILWGASNLYHQQMLSDEGMKKTDRKFHLQKLKLFR